MFEMYHVHGHHHHHHHHDCGAMPPPMHHSPCGMGMGIFGGGFSFGVANKNFSIGIALGRGGGYPVNGGCCYQANPYQMSFNPYSYGQYGLYEQQAYDSMMYGSDYYQQGSAIRSYFESPEYARLQALQEAQSQSQSASADGVDEESA